MPEAAMNHDCGTPARENYVGPAWKALSVQTKAKPASVEKLPHQDLGLRILAAYSRHHATARRLVYNVGHALSYAERSRGRAS